MQTIMIVLAFVLSAMACENCSTTEYCSPNSGKCLSRRALGEYCNVVQLCRENLICSNYKCESLEKPLQPCDCSTTEYCSPNSGECLSRHTLGEYCNVVQLCRENLICSNYKCESLEKPLQPCDCSTTEYCSPNSGECLSRHTLGEYCNIVQLCRENLICSNYKCVSLEKPCANCSTTEYCSPNSGKCLSRRALGEYCNVVQVCRENLICSNRKCVSYSNEKPLQDYLAIPDRCLGKSPTARGSIDDVAYTVEELKDGVYHVTKTNYNSMFVVTSNSVVVFDAPGIYILDAIKNVTTKPISHFIYTHIHRDHAWATAAILSGFPHARIVGTEASKVRLVALADPNRPVPTDVFTTSLDLTVGGVLLQLRTMPDVPHLGGELHVYLPATKTLMLVDLAFPRWVPFYNLGFATNIEAIPGAYAIALSYDFDYYIGGHVGRWAVRSDIEEQLTYFNSVVENAKGARAALPLASELNLAIGTVYRDAPNNIWLASKVAHDKIANYCAKGVIDQWKGVLGAVDVMAFNHCWMVIEHLNVK
jgi:glyoxylase-like metal-dependent hydrolase (beta-lactamase superfamily II)